MSEIEYNYRTIDEIIKSIKLYQNFEMIDIGILILICIIIFGTILYGIPALKAIKGFKKTTAEKTKKKFALKQILIQKEMEEEIENELKLEAQEKMGK